MKNLKSLKGILFAIISSGTFGLIPLFSIPLIGGGMNEASVLFFRFLFSSLMMAVICLVRKENLRISLKQLSSISILGVLYAATALFLIYSYHYMPSGIATTIHFMYPIAVSFIMVVFFKEKRSASLFLAAILSVIGVVFMCWTDSGEIQFMGLVAASITVVTYSSYIVGVNQSQVGRLSAEVLTFYVVLAGAVIFFLFALLTGDLKPIPDFKSFERLLLLAFLCTVVSDFTLVIAIKLVGSTTSSILGSMEPVVAVFVGIIYFSEGFSIFSLVGLVLIIASVIMVVMTSAKKDEIKDSSKYL
mgnify:CR=1 FL=1